jgi:hypothetical protein
MADRGPDILVVLRAETDEEVARTELESVGKGTVIALHPDRRDIRLSVGEGQDGVKSYERRSLAMTSTYTLTGGRERIAS